MKKNHYQVLLAVLSVKFVNKPLMQRLICGLLSCIIIALLACSSEEEPPLIQYVAPELESYFEVFRVDALNHGYAYQLNTSYRVICEKIEGLYVGSSNKTNHTISINPQYLNMPNILEFVMIHECGHYFFEMKHGDNFIMADALDNQTVLEYMQNRQFYLDQFFSISYNEYNKDMSSKNVACKANNNLKCTFQK